MGCASSKETPVNSDHVSASVLESNKIANDAATKSNHSSKADCTDMKDTALQTAPRVKLPELSLESKPTLLVKDDASPATASSSSPPGVPLGGSSFSFPVNASQSPVHFKTWSEDEIASATDGLSEANLVSEGGREATNFVFKGTTSKNEFVAIKQLFHKDFPDGLEFENEAKTIGTINIPGFIPLLGYCSEENARFLVAEYMPHGTLSRRLNHYESLPMTWPQRVNVAIKVARALVELGNRGFEVYHDLNEYRVLFDKRFEPCLSCFGLIKPTKAGSYSSDLANVPPEYFELGSSGVTSASTVYSFGTLLLTLLSGKSIRLKQFLEQYMVADISTLRAVVDSALTEQAGIDSAVELIPLVVSCLKLNPKERPSIGQMLAALEILQMRDKKAQPSPRLERSKSGADEDESLEDVKVPLCGQAALSLDFKLLHQLLVKLHYDTPPTEISLQEWNMEMRDMFAARMKGDQAFKSKQWEEAAKHYTFYAKLKAPRVPLMYGRRSVCYLMMGQWSNALNDAMAAQFEDAEWPEAYFLQAAALIKLDLKEDAETMIVIGSKKDAERQRSICSDTDSRQSKSPSQSPRRRDRQ